MDPWVRGRVYPFVHTPMVLGQEDLRVMDLIDTGRGCWNHSLVDQVFSTEDDDALIWNKQE